MIKTPIPICFCALFTSLANPARAAQPSPCDGLWRDIVTALSKRETKRPPIAFYSQGTLFDCHATLTNEEEENLEIFTSGVIRALLATQERQENTLADPLFCQISKTTYLYKKYLIVNLPTDPSLFKGPICQDKLKREIKRALQ